jgi:hypothetical protein
MFFQRPLPQPAPNRLICIDHRRQTDPGHDRWPRNIGLIQVELDEFLIVVGQDRAPTPADVPLYRVEAQSSLLPVQTWRHLVYHLDYKAGVAALYVYLVDIDVKNSGLPGRNKETVGIVFIDQVGIRGAIEFQQK